MMNQYKDYCLEDFVMDAHFQQWLRFQKPEDETFWRSYSKNNIHQAAEIQSAHNLLKSIYSRFDTQISDDEIQAEIQKLVSKAKMGMGNSEWKIGDSKTNSSSIIENDTDTIRKSSFVNHKFLAIAASIILLLTAGIFYFKAPKSEYIQLTKSQKSLIEKINTTSQPLSIVLNDGSIVTLESGSKMSYPATFDTQKREVYLSGNAFFNVAKNSNQPFLVYANETVTKVLGTSFWIKATDNSNKVEVIVKTGQVSVYAKEEFKKIAQNPNQNAVAVVLTPNQQVVFDRSEQSLKKSVVENPQILMTTENREMRFEDAPITEVLAALEKTYGIKITYDHDTFSKCLITTDFSDEPLFDKLTILCKATGANYEIIDGQIVINSKGCN